MAFDIASAKPVSFDENQTTGFDISTATPVEPKASGFDISTATPVAPLPSEQKKSISYAQMAREGANFDSGGFLNTPPTPEITDKPLVSQEFARKLILQGNDVMPEDSGYTKAIIGAGKGVADTLSGMTSLKSLATLPLYAVPYLGPAIAAYQGAGSVGTGAGNITEAVKQGNPELGGEGVVQVAGGGLMTAPLAHGIAARLSSLQPKVPVDINNLRNITPDVENTIVPELQKAIIDKPASTFDISTAEPVDITTKPNIEVPDTAKSVEPLQIADKVAEIPTTPAKPEIAQLAEKREGQTLNNLGDPRGTKYHATPEDWAEWQRLKSRPMTEEGIFAGREAMKNKYGHMPPEVPKVAEAPIDTSIKPTEEATAPTANLEPKTTTAVEAPKTSVEVPATTTPKPLPEHSVVTQRMGLPNGEGDYTHVNIHPTEPGAQALQTTTPENLRSQGYDVPRYEDIKTQDKYTSEEAQKLLSAKEEQSQSQQSQQSKQSQLQLPEQQHLGNEAPRIIQYYGSKISNGTQLVNILRNKLNPNEWSHYQSQGIEAAFNGKVTNANEISKWTEEHGQRVETRKLGLGSLTKEHQDFLDLQHNFIDNLSTENKELVMNYANGYKTSLEDLSNSLNDTQIKKAEQYKKLLPKINLNAEKSNWQSIAPKPESQMPGYTELAVVKTMKQTGVTDKGYPMIKTGDVQFTSQHNFPENTLAFVRGYMEGDTFHIIELQSDWAQKERRLAERDKTSPPENTILSNERSKQQESLLKHHETIALKAAIEHALSAGATHIAIQDAESAMIMEGHDRELEPQTREVNISQEKGMRLHYDQIIPQIMEKLTGNKGSKVSFGEHKMAVEDKDPREWNSLNERIQVPRQDLIFKNPDGTPKTDVSALSYSLDKVKNKKFPLHGTGTRELTSPVSKKLSPTKTNKAIEPTSNNYQIVKRIPTNVVHNRPPTVEPPKTAIQLGDKQQTIELPDKENQLPVKLTNKPPATVSPNTKLTSGGGSPPIPPRYNEKQLPSSEGSEEVKPTLSLGLFTPKTEAVRKIDKVTGPALADAFKRTYAERSYLLGMFQQGPAQVLREAKLPKESIRKLRTYSLDMDEFGKSEVKLTPREQAVWDTMQREFIVKPREMANSDEYNIRINTPTGQRLGGFTHGYFPDIYNLKTLGRWRTQPFSPEAMYDKRVQINYLNQKIQERIQDLQQRIKDAKSDSQRQALESNLQEVRNDNGKELLRNYIDSLGNKKTDTIDFAALRRAEGYGIARELREPDYLRTFTRYGARVASDLAKSKTLTNNEQMRIALRLRHPNTNELPPESQHFEGVGTIKDISSHPNVQAVMQNLFGVHYDSTLPSQLIYSIGRLANSGLLGPGTYTRNTAQLLANFTPFVQARDMPLLLKAVTQLSKDAAQAFTSGAVRASHGDLLLGNDASSSPHTIVRMIMKAAEGIRIGQGAEHVEKGARYLSYSWAKLIMQANIGRARNGDAAAIAYLRDMGKTLLDEKQLQQLLTKDQPITDDMIMRLSKELVDRGQGRMDDTTLPAWATESWFAPFFQLSRWSIDHYNQVKKPVFDPLVKDKNPSALFKYAFATILTGAAIKKITEYLSGKRGNEPTLREAMTEGDIREKVLAIANLLQLGSFMGIAGDISDYTMNTLLKGIIKKNAPAGYPLATVATTMAQNLADARRAIDDGEDYMDVIFEFTKQQMIDSFQAARYAQAHLNPEETKDKERYRDISTFERLSNLKGITDYTSANSMLRSDEKEFKRTEDIGRAEELRKGIENRIVDKALTYPTDLQLGELRKGFGRLSKNSYQVMPNPKDNPIEFQRYYEFIRKTQGEDAADKLTSDYFERSLVNKMKSRMVTKIH